MTPDEMKTRTRQFALRVLHLVASLPRNRTGDVIGRQLLRAGTSVGANYRAACRSRTDKDFLARMGIVEEEADEVLYWLDLLTEADIVQAERLAELKAEGDEIPAMVVASIKTVKRRMGTARKAKSESPAVNPKSELRIPNSINPNSEIRNPN
ncbi:MAG: four helix bundle protein [Phycisphaerae bacterium]